MKDDIHRHLSEDFAACSRANTTGQSQLH